MFYRHFPVINLKRRMSILYMYITLNEMLAVDRWTPLSYVSSAPQPRTLL